MDNCGWADTTRPCLRNTPLIRTNPNTTDIDRNHLNVAIYKERLAELAQENLTPEQLTLAKQELEKNLAQELDDGVKLSKNQSPNCWQGVLVAICIPALALGGYLKLGSFQFSSPTGIQASQAEGEGHNNDGMDDAIATLEARLKEQPDDLEKWQLLARSYIATGKSEKAIAIYNNILAQFGQNPQILADFAELLAQSNDSKMTGLPTILLKTALDLDPDNQKALFLSGLAAMEQGDNSVAVTHWERLLTQIPPEATKVRDMLEQNIARARQSAEVTPTDKPKSPTEETEKPALTTAPTDKPKSETATEAKATNLAQIEVHVSLAPALQDKVKPNDTLFIYARATKGSPMPLAIARKLASELPITVTLDDSMAMMPAMKLSNFEEVAILARISQSGLATQQSGDLKGQISPVNLKAQNKVEVTIDQIVP
ncbi:TPR repeat containing protein [Beggiatoa sp. PS]|nr:TPR repeat containing protein [Beggiatoa sp. PS]